MRLHSTVGPARTTLSAVAEEAGVSRPTLYSHFPDEVSLFQACTLHWMSQDPPPDPTVWLEITDPRERIQTALDQIYAHFRRNEKMIDNVFRDMNIVDHMRSFNKPLVEESFAAMADALVTAFGDPPGGVVRRRAMVYVAISFETWRTLTRSLQLSDAGAVDIMTRAVQCAADATDSTPGASRPPGIV